jgi:dihydroorotate dehydrogenase
MDTEKSDLYANLIRPLLFRLDPESAHQLLYGLAPVADIVQPLLESLFRYDNPVLTTEVAGSTFNNPIGIAAGFDKNAKFAGLIHALGFGYAEIGSITAQPSRGNPKPRLFRLPDDEAVINRLGLNGDGAARIAERLAALEPKTPYGVNIAKTNDPAVVGDKAIEDLLLSFRTVVNLPLAYITVNASCPNTHDGVVQEVGELKVAMQQMQSENSQGIPLFLKLSPDSSDSLLDSLLTLGRDCGVKGYVCGNTSVSRSGLKTDARRLEEIGRGGLSGKPIKELALSLCQRVIARKEPEQAVIACGGITSASQIFELLHLGVSAVQLYTGLIYGGPGLVRSAKQQLAHLLDAEKTSVREVVRAARSQPIGL